MMYTINGAMLALSSWLAVSILAKATLITTIALAAAWLARGARAAVRHMMLAASFAALLALPAASLLVPPVRIAVARQADAPPSVASAIDVTQTTAPAPAGDAVAPSSTSQLTEHEVPLYDLLLAGWIAGAAVFVLRMIVGLRGVHLLRRSSMAWRDGQALLDQMASEAGFHRKVDVLLHESLSTPVTCGIFLPVILLPCDAQNWHGEDLNRAIIHELEHVRRADWVSQCLARAVCAAYWFHPLVWIAWRRLSLEAERSCDDAVLGRSEATAYADQLVGLAKRLSVAQRAPLLAMVNNTDLATRVAAVLDSRQRRGRAGTVSLALACAAAVVLVLVISPLTVVAAPQAQSHPSFEVASVKQLGNRQGDGPDLSFVGTSGNPFKISGNRISVNGTLHAFIAAAYSLKDYQVSVGVPSWADSLMFNITALGPGPAETTQDQARVMLESLLADRFQVKFHRESKVLPVYYLVQSKSSKNFTPAGADETFSWNVTQEPGGVMRSKATKESIGDFVQLVGASADRPVINKTGITGFIDYDLRYELPRATGPSAGEGGGGGKHAPNPDDLNRALIAAIQDQLGLKLQSTKDMVDILVIDSAERPSEN